MPEQDASKPKRSRKKFLIPFAVIAACLVLYVLFMTTPVAKPVLLSRANQDLQREFVPIDAVLSKNGVSVVNGQVNHCGYANGDRTENYHCMKLRDWQRDVDAWFTSNWKNTAEDFERVFNANGWTKKPNTDPITMDVVKGLKDLVQAKPEYLTEVNYTKKAGRVDCSIRFTVTPDESSSAPTRFEAFEQCTSRFR